jgi:hypothetical protein
MKGRLLPPFGFPGPNAHRPLGALQGTAKANIAQNYGQFPVFRPVWQPGVGSVNAIAPEARELEMSSIIWAALQLLPFCAA